MLNRCNQRADFAALHRSGLGTLQNSSAAQKLSQVPELLLPQVGEATGVCNFLAP
jgi:hypothetical protein